MPAVESGGPGLHRSPLSHGGAAIDLGPLPRWLTAAGLLCRPVASPPRRTKVVPQFGILPPMVTAPPINACTLAFPQVKRNSAHAERAAGPAADPPPEAGHEGAGADDVLVDPAAQAPTDCGYGPASRRFHKAAA